MIKKNKEEDMPIASCGHVDKVADNISQLNEDCKSLRTRKTVTIIYAISKETTTYDQVFHEGQTKIVYGK